MNYNFIYLSLLFVASGLLGIIYYTYLLNKSELKKRIPNRATVESVVLFLIIVVLVWYILHNFTGLIRTSNIIALIIGLLLFETIFLLLLRWFKSNTLNALISFLTTVAVFAMHFSNPTFVTFNAIIILSTLGATALMIRLEFIKTWMVFGLTAIWMPYDYYFVSYILPKFTKITANPVPFFAFPSVTIGDIGLGVGDFVFLALFTFVLFHDFGRKPATIHIILQGSGLLVASYLVSIQNIIVPFLLILSPIFFIIYFSSYLYQKKQREISRLGA
ncbi:hypothetical protein IID19_04560 [Patescibacteria group bacterium]|nr:hypothetical protein [Patescibacteria group bacterium]